ncbi:MAG: hypothetical protein CMC08_06190 [Flavobacteriaceae bacterium]|nr:hypothetical protein [Flavobacteriaceae bacterium]
MKQVLLYVLLGASVALKAQDPQLLENDWYLNKVTINDLNYTAPNDLFGSIVFNQNFLEVIHAGCEEGFGTFVQYLQNNTFTTDDGGAVLIGTCGDPDIIEFMDRHYSIYYDLDTEVSKGAFSYTFEQNSGVLYLTIENSEGNQAEYTNQQLGVGDIQLSALIVYPNPTANTLTLDNLPEGVGALTATVVTLDGKRVLQNKGLAPNEPMDVSALASGVYFLQLEGPKGERLVRKFVKE